MEIWDLCPAEQRGKACNMFHICHGLFVEWLPLGWWVCLQVVLFGGGGKGETYQRKWFSGVRSCLHVYRTALFLVPALPSVWLRRLLYSFLP